MLFKGSRRRDARQIAESLESVGGGLNGFTGREKTCYQARILDEHLSLAVDVLSDLVINPRLDPLEVEREKQVVMDEIRDLEDSPSDLIDERIAGIIWRGNTLGLPISGTAKTVSSFTSRSLRDRLRGWYRPDRMVVAAAGNLDHENLVGEVRGAFSFPDGRPGRRRRSASFDTAGNKEVLQRKVNQMHICLGGLTYPYADSRKYALLILNTVLGDGMSSRLFQNVRERKGLAYAVHSYLAMASDTGLFNIYIATEPGKSQDAFRAVLLELDRLRDDGLTEKELFHTKAQLKGRLMLGLESMSARMVRLAQQEILLDSPVSLDETRERIDAVSGKQVQEIAGELFQRRRLSLAAIGPGGEELFDLKDLWG
jgi:predicted Zn-dependent peptidase